MLRYVALTSRAIYIMLRARLVTIARTRWLVIGNDLSPRSKLYGGDGEETRKG
jgi:hypothetical protein